MRTQVCCRTQLGCKSLIYSMVGKQLSTAAECERGERRSPVGASATEGGWKVGVRAAGPAPRAPKGTAVGETTEPPGNDPPPSLPGPDASSHLEATALSTQSCTAWAKGVLANWHTSAR
jgi:hypothetical protein